MKAVTARYTHRALALSMFGIVAAFPLTAQEHAHEEHHGVPQVMMSDVETMGNKFIELADAMPAESYSWKPMDGVRSVSEVYMLIVAENYAIPSMWGAMAPEGVEVGRGTFQAMAQVTDKEAVMDHLRKSVEYFQHTLSALTPDQLNNEINFFGGQRSVHDAIFAIVGDMHEHLGQAIAYARSNHVVPPWTARAQARQSGQ